MRLQGFVATLLFACIATIAQSDASAAGVYKTIGLDGKVTFSDKPPAEAATADKIDVVRTPTESLAPHSSNDASVTFSLESKASQSSNIKQTVAVDESQRRFAVAADPDPVIEKAITGILSHEDLVRQAESLCVSTLPTSYERYSGAADGWRSRNAALVAQAHQVLSEQYNSPQRQTIESGIRAKNNAALMPVSAASTAAKINWCDNSSDAIKNGTLDIYNRSNLSTPLVKARS